MCLNPLRGWLSNGHVVKVTKSNVNAILFQADKIIKYYDNNFPDMAMTEYIDIPCRSCLECYNQARREWITRAVAEAQCHDKIMFVTMTYNDDNIPVSEFFDCDGVQHKKHTLRYLDFQLFMKRLRKAFSDRKIRYMVCGEYGTMTFRPHYHAIIYGIDCSDFDCQVYSKNSKGDILYNSKKLDKIWKLGYIIFSNANTATMSYVAGYVAKKSETLKGKKYYEFTGCVAPFINSSLRPALGAKWLSENMHKFSSIYDYCSVPCCDGEPVRLFLTANWRMKYEQKLFVDDFNSDCGSYTEYLINKDYRRMKLSDNRFKLLRTDMSKSEYNDSLSIHFRNSWKRKRGVY